MLRLSVGSQSNSFFGGFVSLLFCHN
jgi:hypothetical protein